MAERILVVEDEKPIAEILKFNLEREGYKVVQAFNGQEALAVARQAHPDLVILDLMLPKLDGFAVCRELRRISMIPIIMLTAKAEELDKVLGLELGADDYVTKPFSPRELLARVKALLRRASAPPLPGPREIRSGELAINLDRYQVTKGPRTLDLTFREFELLKYLALHSGQVFSREVLLEKVWGYEYFGDSRTVDVTVRRLREKIEDDPSNPRYVQTRRGVGYFFRQE